MALPINLISVLVCPETKQSLQLADPSLIEQLNTLIKQSLLKNRSGRLVDEPLEEGLIRKDRKGLYPVRNGVPIMIFDEGISLENIL